ncbi:MAG: hypothetical protein RR863_04710 [Erysipelotrichaceae bacterium]
MQNLKKNLQIGIIIILLIGNIFTLVFHINSKKVETIQGTFEIESINKLIGVVNENNKEIGYMYSNNSDDYKKGFIKNLGKNIYSLSIKDYGTIYLVLKHDGLISIENDNIYEYKKISNILVSAGTHLK